MCFHFLLSIREPEQWLKFFSLVLELQNSLESQCVHCFLFYLYSHTTTWPVHILSLLTCLQRSIKRICFKKNRKLIEIRAQASPCWGRWGLVTTGIGFDILDPNLPAVLPDKTMMKVNIHEIPHYTRNSYQDEKITLSINGDIKTHDNL